MLAYNSLLKVALLALAATQATAKKQWSIKAKKDNMWFGLHEHTGTDPVGCTKLDDYFVSSPAGILYPDEAQIATGDFEVNFYAVLHACGSDSSALLSVKKKPLAGCPWPVKAKYYRVKD
ncbi:Uu.00g058060.m01.CDS01 [Anthostomella pinea]|uniref:Uu.00g058060.m01.CDS01 n=1 Tax=Anthostomella pinea TaxID=933095 RepID=A0AAI8VRV6_9PEZI|nr:Uu.00g058060.m01.CDS01 [Anthostomella pinea]